jgi:uncharacterized protein (DUF433 family)
MRPEDLIKRITTDPEVMVGKPVIRGLRITVDQVLKALAGGLTVEALLQDYPDLEKEDVQAALIYAAALVEEEKVFAIR